VTDWAGLETSTEAVTLAIDINSDGIPELNTTTGTGISGQELWFHRSEQIAGRTVALSYQGIYVVNIESVAQPGAIPKGMRSLRLFIRVTSTGNVSNLIITIRYNVSDIPSDADKTTLKMYYWDETLSQWVLVEDSGVWLNNNTVWANVTHLTIFTPMAEKAAEEKLGLATLLSYVIILAIVIVLIGTGLGIKKIKKQKPATVNCPKCGENIQITSTERPVEIVCPKCGAKETLTEK